MKATTYEVADSPALRDCDSFADPRTGTVYCTRRHLRDRLRAVFDRRAQEQPFLTVWHKPDPRRGGTIYEGLRIDSWSGLGDDETAGFTQMELPRRSIRVAEIRRLTVFS